MPYREQLISEPPIKRTHWQRTSLRVRAAIILTFFFLVTALIIGATFRATVHIILNQNIDTELQEDGEEFAELLESRDLNIDADQGRIWNRRASVHVLHHWFIRIINADKNVEWESISFPASQVPDLDPNGDGFQHWGIYRVIQRPIWNDGNSASQPGQSRTRKGWVQIGCSLENLDQSLTQMDMLLGTIFLILTVCGPLISIFLTSRLLNPLLELTKKTDELKVERNEHLLKLGGSGDELDRLANTINSLLIRVRSQIKQHEDWIANSAHQLRSPLAAIMSNVEVVLARLPDGKSSTMLESVLAECEFLNKLVNQLLLLSEASAGGIHQNLDIVQLDALVARSCEFFEVLASSKDIQLICHPMPQVSVKANPEYIRIVIHNMLDNAIKYSKENGTIDVKLTLDEDNSQVTFTVSDTGIGISPEDLTKISQRFFRIDSGRDPASTPRGSGLGLNIVKTIVQKFGGEFQIESELNVGTSVHITIPIARSTSH